ncbi:hypothetical protein IB276_11775 [Ensifer sp. ENS04]|uniref:GcrA family cell cycle regulator n=1 Tax=Ensifer sp. ENS04 TaxID=2769281 RepID=UPI0017843ED3|nr:GcrA family cell cycle regulator [Ensifer sp. ENS04]MBD9540132.1 hypothetical protein [Ensifer sp. ENS04]
MLDWTKLNTEQRIAEVKNAQKFSTGTARTLARYLSAKFQQTISRNAVIGLYGRNPDAFADMPLSGVHSSVERDTKGQFKAPAPKQAKPKPAPKLKVVAPPKIKAVKAKPEPSPDVPKPTPMLKKIMDHDWDGRHECRWPVDGEKEHTRFCCAPASAETSYCDYHRLVARGRGTESERKVAPMPVRKVA